MSGYVVRHVEPRVVLAVRANSAPSERALSLAWNAASRFTAAFASKAVRALLGWTTGISSEPKHVNSDGESSDDGGNSTSKKEVKLSVKAMRTRSRDRRMVPA